MSQILATATFAPPGGPTLATGLTVASAVISVNDAGSVQNDVVDGSETPPWSAAFTVPAGAGTVTFTRTDSAGNVGAPIVVNFDTTAGQPGAPDLVGGTVQIVTP